MNSTLGSVVPLVERHATNFVAFPYKISGKKRLYSRQQLYVIGCVIVMNIKNLISWSSLDLARKNTRRRNWLIFQSFHYGVKAVEKVRVKTD